MAEIKIEKRTAIWPWILLALGTLALLIYLISYFKKGDPVSTNQSGQERININEDTPAVAGYIAFVNADTATMSLDHAYTSRALTKLADAASAVAAHTGYALPADVNRVKAQASEITQDPYTLTHADSIRNAADILSRALGQMQQEKYPALSAEADQLQAAAAAINPDVQTLEQRAAVKSFFKQAAALLQKMN